MITKIKSKNVILPRGVGEAYVYLDGGKIAYVGTEERPFDEEYDVGEDYLAPGLIDIHTHGAMGFDYAEADVSGILAAVKFQLSHGATSVMPTITSSTYEKTYAALERLEAAMKDETYGQCILGAHLEGPYFSPKQSGAQDPSLIKKPQKNEYGCLVERFGGIIKRWDYAPELDPDGEFCAYLTKHKILASAGHTDATMRDMETARANGCKLITHLYSCTSTITRDHGFRILGVTECAYLWDDIYAEIIADGKHLPPELLRLIFKLKRHDRLILVSDSLRVAGSADKFSTVGTVKCIIEDGVCKLPDRSAFAGSIATADTLIKTCVNDAGLDVLHAIRMGSANPSALFGLKRGQIRPGYDADLITFDREFKIKNTWKNGEKI